jgi:hypothetical protein
VSGEAYVGEKLRWKIMNNKKLVLYEPAVSVGADPLTAENFTGSVLMAEHSAIKYKRTIS